MLSLDEWIALLETGKATVEAQVIVTSCVVAVALIVTFVYENWLRKVIEKIIWLFIWPAAFIYLCVCGIGTWNAGECTLDLSFFITADHTMTVGNVLADYLF